MFQRGVEDLLSDVMPYLWMWQPASEGCQGRSRPGNEGSSIQCTCTDCTYFAIQKTQAERLVHGQDNTLSVAVVDIIRWSLARLGRIE